MVSGLEGFHCSVSYVRITCELCILNVSRCLDELEDTKKALETAHMICSKATVAHTELQVEVPTLFQCIK